MALISMLYILLDAGAAPVQTVSISPRSTAQGPFGDSPVGGLGGSIST